MPGPKAPASIILRKIHMNAETDKSPERLSEYVWVTKLSLPPDHPEFIATYLIQDKAGDFHVIDPGWDSEENWVALNQSLKTLGTKVSAIHSVTLTHQHRDHIGLSERIQSEAGCPIAIHAFDELELQQDYPTISRLDRSGQIARWGVPQNYEETLWEELNTQKVNMALSLRANLGLVDQDFLLIPGRNLLVHHTPGHTPGHICIEDLDKSTVFTGDHVIESFNPGVGLGRVWHEDSMVNYLNSLKIIEKIDSQVGWPGHGPVINNLQVRSRIIREHHEQRIHRVEKLLTENPERSVWEITQELKWSQQIENMSATTMRMVLSQTEMYLFAVKNQVQ